MALPVAGKHAGPVVRGRGQSVGLRPLLGLGRSHGGGHAPGDRGGRPSVRHRRPALDRRFGLGHRQRHGRSSPGIARPRPVRVEASALRIGRRRLTPGRDSPWTDWIAIAPSPTADATRLTELSRTSPAAKTPGMLFSEDRQHQRPPAAGTPPLAPPRFFCVPLFSPPFFNTPGAPRRWPPPARYG